MASNRLPVGIDPYANVSLTPIYAGGAYINQQSVQVEHEGKLHHVGIVSDSYTLVPNVELAEEIRMYLSDSDFNFSEAFTAFDGRKFRTRFILNGSGKDVAGGLNMGGQTRHVGDVLDFHADLINSYDGTRKYGLLMGVTILKCTNGMVMPQVLGEFSFKHNDKQGSIDAITNAISIAAVAFENKCAKKFESMSNRILASELVKKYMEVTGVPNNVVCAGFEHSTGNTTWDYLMGLTDYFKQENSIISDLYNKKSCKFFMDVA